MPNRWFRSRRTLDRGRLSERAGSRPGRERGRIQAYASEPVDMPLSSGRLATLLTTSRVQVNRLQRHERSTVIPAFGTALIGAILGLTWFMLVFGPSVLDPTYLSWVMHGDGAQHVLGWLFFRRAPWSWRLGAVPSFPYPVGTTVGYTDSIPWLAIAAKVLSPHLPVDFQ